jgi:cyanophycinase
MAPTAASALLLAVALSASTCSADTHTAGEGWDMYCYDNGTDTGCGAPARPAAPPAPGMVLMGGGADVDAAFEWMIVRSGGGGHFVVIRTDQDPGYNPYVYALANGTLLSVSTIITHSRGGAAAPEVLGVLANASALWIAGGNQDDYVNQWNGTAVQAALQRGSTRVPLGGTSAGMGVQSEFVYTAEGPGGSAESAVVLANPYDSSVTLAARFLSLPLLRGAIADMHFAQRDRMGRLLGFMARLLTDAWPAGHPAAVRGVACDEQSAALVDPAVGVARVLVETDGPTHVCYFMTAYAAAPRVCAPGTNLTLADVTVFRASSAEGGAFDLAAWAPVPGSGGASYNVSAVNGALASTQPGGDWY